MSEIRVSQRRLCLVGATGLVGLHIIAQAVSRPELRVIAVARREAPLPSGAKMEMLVAEPEAWGDAIAASNAHVLVCALGTTFRKAGRDETAFRAVDHDLVLASARAAKAAGIGHMIAVSSVGADRASRGLYLRVKGEVEDALAKLGFRRLDIVRPGLIRGRREETRIAERLAMVASPLSDALLHGQLRRFRSIGASTLAQAVLALSAEKAGGRFIHDYDAIHRAIRRGRGDRAARS